MSTLDVAWLLANPGSEAARAQVRVRLEGDRVASIEPLAGPGGEAVSPGAGAPAGGVASMSPRRLLLPALANAHDHARTFRSASIGAYGQPLETWLPYLGLLPGADPYLCAATSFARSARRGVASLMVHYTRVQGGMPYVEEARAVARAARDVGLRIGFAVAIRDRNGIAYGDDASVLPALRPGIRDAVSRRLGVPPSTVADHLARVDEVAQMVADEGFGEHVTVQYGPTAVQWCTTPLLEAVARASADTGRPVHMHLLETRYQREWADRELPGGIVRHLDEIGLLGPRLTLAHCTWARPDELALIAERGATIAVNTSSNLALKSGIAPVAEMLRQGCRVAMGLDGLGFDEDDDPLREMRLAYSLHRGWGFETEMSAAQLWSFAARHGRRSVSGVDGGGLIAPGEPADLLVLDHEALDDDSLFPDIDPLHLLLARGNAGHVDRLLVGGRTVVSSGQVVTVDEPALRAELLAQVRARLAADAQAGGWRDTLSALAEDLGPFYRRGGHPGCC